MKKFDLRSELKAVRVPEREQEFWDAFPRRVLAELDAAPPAAAIHRSPRPGLAWSLGMAVACVAVCFCLWKTALPRMLCYTVIRNERQMRQAVRQFPEHVQAFMLDEHGLGKLIEDKP